MNPLLTQIVQRLSSPPWRSSTATQTSRNPWILYLADELIIQIMCWVQVDNGDNCDLFALVSAFPEFQRFVLLIVDSSTPQIIAHVKSNFGRDIETVSLQQYATLNHIVSKRRPLKCFLLHLDRTVCPALWFDASGSSLIGRFLDHYSTVYSSTTTTSPLNQLYRSKNILDRKTLSLSDEIQTVIGYSRPLLLDYQSLVVPTTGNQLSIISDQPGFHLQLHRDSPQLPWHFDNQHIQSLRVVNCDGTLTLHCPLSLKRLEIVTKEQCETGHYMLSVNIHRALPSELLHVKFPGRYGSPKIITGSSLDIENSPRATLVLENTDWSPSMPHGLPVYRDPRGHDHSHYVGCIITGGYRVVDFIGIDETALLISFLSSVISLHWRRLSPQTPTRYDGARHSVRKIVYLLEDLLIESVRRADESFLSFNSEALKRLTLISLHDSDTAWSLNSLLYNTPKHLEDMYIERRLDEEREPPDTKLEITAHDISRASDSLKRLHLRGYVPLLVLSSTPSYGRRFKRLRTFMLDISQITPTSLTNSDKEMGTISLTFRQENFPALNTLILMCTKESRKANALSNVHIDITIKTRSIRVLRVCSLIISPLIKVNGYVLKNARRPWRQKAYIPVVESRLCSQWVSPMVPFHWKFYYDTDVILGHEYDHWLRDVREY